VLNNVRQVKNQIM